MKAFRAPVKIEAIIGEFPNCYYEGMYVSGYIPNLFEISEFNRAVLRDRQWVILVDGAPVCWAWSERSNDQCAEVAVETLPEFQRLGYGRQVVAAWVNDVIGSGRTALYMGEADNRRKNG